MVATCFLKHPAATESNFSKKLKTNSRKLRDGAVTFYLVTVIFSQDIYNQRQYHRSRRGHDAVYKTVQQIIQEIGRSAFEQGVTLLQSI